MFKKFILVLSSSFLYLSICSAATTNINYDGLKDNSLRISGKSVEYQYQKIAGRDYVYVACVKGYCNLDFDNFDGFLRYEFRCPTNFTGVSNGGVINYNVNGKKNGIDVPKFDCKPIDGQCGSTNGKSFGSEDAFYDDMNNYCSQGYLENVEGKGPWTWVCKGIGLSAPGQECSANLVAPCGSAHTENYSKLSSDNELLCNQGGSVHDFQFISGSNQWSWICGGTGSEECIANKKIHGECGTAVKDSFYDLTASYTGLCTEGIVDGFYGQGPWTWTCKGIHTGKDNNDCKAAKKEDGVCGDGSPLCEKGKVVNYAGSGPWTWNCQGIDGGIDSVQCTASDVPCGIAGGGEYENLDENSSELCQVGNKTGFVYILGTDTYERNCLYSGFISDLCIADKLHPEKGECNNAAYTTHYDLDLKDENLLCKGGILYNTGFDGDKWTRDCKGIDYASSDNCDALIKDDGKCGIVHGTNSENIPSDDQLCKKGDFVWIDKNAIDDQWDWRCDGVRDGISPTCYTKRERSGRCGTAADTGQEFVDKPVANLCEIGDPEPVTTGADGKWTWKCKGSPNAICSATRTCSYVSSWDITMGECKIDGQWQTIDDTTKSIKCSRQIESAIALTYATGKDLQCPHADEPQIPIGQTDFDIQLVPSSNTCHPDMKYADYIQTCSVNYKLEGDPLKDINVGLTGFEGLIAKNITYPNPGGLSLPIFTEISNDGRSPSKNYREYYLRIGGIKSSMPFLNLSGTLSFKMQGKDSNYTDLGFPTPIGFKKIFTGEMYSDNGLLRVGVVDNLLLRYTPMLGVDTSSISNTPSISKYEKDLLILKNDYYLVSGANISGTNIEYKLGYAGTLPMLQQTIIIGSVPYISYDLGGITVKYQLTVSDSPTDVEPLWIEDDMKIVKILGNFRIRDLESITKEDDNNVLISNTAINQMRSQINKNVASITNGVKEGELTNGIYYKDLNGSDISITTLKTLINLDKVDTLIIKNGNLIIDENLLPTNILGIIVLNEDGEYLSESKGNIIVNNDVDYIQAVIYADGSLKGTGGGEDQLIIIGSLMTRNTLYGAIEGDDGCFDPGGKSIDCDVAQKYDLAYIRIASDDPDPQGLLNTNEFKDYSLIIKYDANFQSNPPKGFK